MKGLIMKKLITILAVSLLMLNAAHGNVEQETCCETTKIAQQSNCSFFNCECTQQFFKGVAAGAAAGLSVEYLRNYILPDMTSWNLYGNYGVCRDQLTGEFKVATAALGIAALSKEHYSKFKVMGSQLLGVIVGACAASYATKLLTAPAAPAAPAQAQ
jgi:hypothetical protein